MDNFEKKTLISNIFFYHRTYLNGKQILLNKECIENLSHLLDEKKPKNRSEIKNFFSLENIKKIYGNLIPKDAELLDQSLPSFDGFSFSPIINFYSKSSYKKIKNKPSLFKHSDFKLLSENKKYKMYEYHSPKKSKKDFYSIFIIGFENYNRIFINGFLNYLFDAKEEDNFRLVLDTYKDKNENPIATFFINSKKGDFAFYCLNVDNKKKIKSIEEILSYVKSIENNSINLILFSMYLVENEPYIELNDSEKFKVFFASPSLGFDMIKYNILDKILTISETLKKRELDEKLIKAIIIHIAKRDESIRLKFNSSNFIYDSIFSEEKNTDIFYKYNITMKGFKSFYEAIIKRKKDFIDFSPILKYLTSITELSKDIIQKMNLFDSQKGENWTEYHLYEIKIKSLEKENEKKKKEKSDLEKQKEELQNFKYVFRLKEKINQGKNLDTLINENNSIINSNLEDIKLLEDKRKQIFKDNQEKINEEIRKFNNKLNPNNIDNLKEYHKLIIEDLKVTFTIQEYGKSSSGRCC